MIPQQITFAIERFFNQTINNIKPVGGGSIIAAYSFTVNKEAYFVKFNSNKRYPKIIEYEVEGLRAIEKANQIKIPDIIYYNIVEDYEVLLLPFIASERPDKLFWQKFGQQLAALHLVGGQAKFGWSQSNYIGSLPQDNAWEQSFPDFWVKHRIKPQLKLAEQSKKLTSEDLACFDMLFSHLDEIFPATKPSLVHGDLWSGNFIANNSLGPILIDPAIHYGAAETDLAFTHLFGGFDKEFYSSYQEVNPLPTGFTERVSIYNLYPLLVHLNLFGSSYYYPICQVISQFK